MRGQPLRVEWFDPQADVVDVVAAWTVAAAAASSRRAIGVDQVDHRGACAQVHQSQVCPHAHELAAEHPLVEVDAALQVADPEHDVVDALDPERWRRVRAHALPLR